MYELRPNVGHSAAWLQRPGLILVCDLLLLRFVCGGWRSSACCRTASTKVVMALSKIGPVFHFEFQNSVLPNMITEPKWEPNLETLMQHLWMCTKLSVQLLQIMKVMLLDVSQNGKNGHWKWEHLNSTLILLKRYLLYSSTLGRGASASSSSKHWACTIHKRGSSLFVRSELLWRTSYFRVPVTHCFKALLLLLSSSSPQINTNRKITSAAQLLSSLLSVTSTTKIRIEKKRCHK